MHIRLWLVVLVAVIAFGEGVSGSHTAAVRAVRSEPMHVLFPVQVLLSSQGQLAIDPRNLASAQGYYLLENLALGLLRDDPTAPLGFAPCLARSWQQVDEKTWTFALREDLRFSDGSPLTGDYVAEEMRSLATRNSRHLRLLRKLQQVDYDPASHHLTLRFESNAGGGVLHELSLADAVILHPSNKSFDWSVTSGPYSVGSIAESEQTLILRKNLFSPVVIRNPADELTLFWPLDRADLEKAFRELPVDLFFTVAQIFSRRQQIMISQAPQVYRGDPNSLYFFRFNQRDPHTHSERTRREFASLVRQAVVGLQTGPDLAADTQFIPVGYSGRLPDSPLVVDELISKLSGSTLRLLVNQQWQDVPAFFDRLQAVGAAANVKFEIVYGDALDMTGANGEFAALMPFRGNQADALGTWSFFFSKEGPMEQFEADVHGILQDIAETEDPEARERELRRLHELALRRVYGVPVFFERVAALGRSDLDFSRINRFDMRNRFYEIGRHSI